MNPETNQFERIEPESAQAQKAKAEKWPTFRVGELLPVRGYRFIVESISAGQLVLKPYGPVKSRYNEYLQRARKPPKKKAKH